MYLHKMLSASVIVLKQNTKNDFIVKKLSGISSEKCNKINKPIIKKGGYYD